MVKGKVIEKEEVNDEEIEEETSGEEEVEQEIEKPKTGDLMPYTKEIEYGVLDEEGNRVPCETIAIAKILSLLLEKKK